MERVRLRLEPDTLWIDATDLYTVAQDAVPVWGVRGRPNVVVHANRKALEALATEARQDKAKDTSATLTLSERDGVTVMVSGREPFHADTAGVGTPDKWKALDELLAYVDERPASLPEVVMLNPEYLARLNKVRPDKTDRRADFWFSGSDMPVLVKIGPTFRALIQPVIRAVHAANVGEDGLW